MPASFGGAACGESRTDGNPGVIPTRRSRRTPRSAALRLSFELDPEGNDQVEIRVDLRSGERPIAETWVYRWSQ